MRLKSSALEVIGGGLEVSASIFAGVGIFSSAERNGARKFWKARLFQAPADVDEIYADFKAAVLARGRRITPDVMEGQCFSGRKASYNSLTSGVVLSRAEALMKLRERHVEDGRG